MHWPQDLLDQIEQLPVSVKYVVGIDEVGRGSIAGPMTIGVCVVMRKYITNFESIPGLDDSKRLSADKRRKVLKHIISYDSNHSSILKNLSISAKRIDRMGIRESYFDLLSRLNKFINPNETMFLMDYGIPIPIWMVYYQSFKKGDAAVPVIAAASIYAKQMRDRYMKTTVHKRFPEYRFDQHVGYGTKFHREQIMKHGTCNQHRETWIKESNKILDK